MGYRLMGTGKLKDAIEIFRLNVELYPESANAYESLGEAYMNSGDTKKRSETTECPFRSIQTTRTLGRSYGPWRTVDSLKGKRKS